MTTLPIPPRSAIPLSKRKTFRFPTAGLLSPPMYPPLVSDHAIRLLIRELTEGDQLPSGAQLRAALHQRFGSRGGVTRIYRLLSSARPKPPSSLSASSDVGKLEREVRTLREALALAEHREQAHQSRWAAEVDRLRQQVATLEPMALKTKAALDAAELLRRELHAAHIRFAALEQQLLEAQNTHSGTPDASTGRGG
jgi:hypothetical protein